MDENERKYDLDWSGVSEDMARQILHQGERFLESQLAAGVAADQRAITGASLFSGFAVAALGGTLAYWSAHHDQQLLFAGLVASAVLLAGAMCCVHAGRSVDFHYPGAVPVKWWEVRNHDLVGAIGGETENYQERIEINAEILSTNARWMKWGTGLAILSPLIAAIAWTLPSILAVIAPAFHPYP